VQFATESTPFGRIVVAPFVPANKAVFYTTIDFHGRLDHAIARDVSDFLAQRFGIEASLATCTQIHSANVQRVGFQSRWRECDACDAIWTSDPHVALGIKTADCLPVSIIAGDVIGNIHSGWRGAVAQITSGTIDAMHIDTATAYAWLGPTIRVCCFEVGEEVAEKFPSRFVDRSHPTPHVDVSAFTVAMLVERGFAADHVFDAGLCTRCNKSMFHSYRRDKNTGRNLAIVAQ